VAANRCNGNDQKNVWDPAGRNAARNAGNVQAGGAEKTAGKTQRSIRNGAGRQVTQRQAKTAENAAEVTQAVAPTQR